MSIRRLYCPTLTRGPLVLSEEESHHALAVLRLRPGDIVTLFDGAGSEARATVTKASRRRLEVDASDITQHPFDLSVRLTLAVATPKAHRQAYLIEKCTELGVAALWPMVTERSVTKPGKTTIEKWTRRAIEAIKQSRRSWLPILAQPQGFGQVIERISEFDAAGILHPDASACPLLRFLRHRVPIRNAQSPLAAPPLPLLMLIGPEGGWSDGEFHRATDAGVTPIHLGHSILRTETAAAAVCAAVTLCDSE